MLKAFCERKGQSTIEYAALIVIILGAFIAMQNYAKRGIQGRWKQATDQMGDQYDPRVMDTDVRHVLIANTDTAIITINAGTGYWTTRQDMTNTYETKTGYSQVGSY